MKIAVFHNFTNEDFIGFWGGKPHTFKSGAKKTMEEGLARHFAKHLTNRELLKKGGVYENYTSPKIPEDVPQFMEIFNKACLIEDTEDKDEVDLSIGLNNEPSMNLPEMKEGPGKEPQVITGPDDDEEEFEKE